MTRTVYVLLVENNAEDARLIQQALADDDDKNVFCVEWVKRISSALDCLTARNGRAEHPFDVILLDLNLPDAQGLSAVTSLFEAAPDALVLILSDPEHEETARAALQNGAYDYLRKTHVNSHWLPRALRYVTERKEVEAVLRRSEELLFEEKERAQVTLNSIGDAVLSTDLKGNVTYLNQVAEEMTGWTRQDALGLPLMEVFRIIDGSTLEPAINPAERAIRENCTVGLAADCVLIRRDGLESAIEDSSAPIHNRMGEVSGAVIVFRDVTQSRAMAQKMAHLAQHDFLTGLPNRLLMMERLVQAIGLAQRHQKHVALMFLDLDFFKHINDSLGHAIGDRLLQSVARRLSACVRTTDTLCRQGGDEFVVLLAEIEQPNDAALVASKLLETLARPHQIGNHELHVSLSIGISVYPQDGDTMDALMQNADTAMYHAKATGRNRYQFFQSEMNTRAMECLLINGNLHRALTQHEFLLHYQPQIDLKSGAMTGAEALIRWQDPANGLVYPAQFISVAEETGLIIPIGRWVMLEVCSQIRAWLDAGLCVVPVSVNVSAVELRSGSFVEELAYILAKTQVQPRYLELELTESVLLQDAESSAVILEELKAMGIRLAIDDFGTGYSSLSYLKRFPIDTLKIDGSFVRDMATNTDDAAIVSAVIGMGRNLKQRVVAEGVESCEQLAILLGQKCETGQGFQFSKPLRAVDFESLLVARQDGP